MVHPLPELRAYIVRDGPRIFETERNGRAVWTNGPRRALRLTFNEALAITRRFGGQVDRLEADA